MNFGHESLSFAKVGYSNMRLQFVDTLFIFRNVNALIES